MCPIHRMEIQKPQPNLYHKTKMFYNNRTNIPMLGQLTESEQAQINAETQSLSAHKFRAEALL